MTLGQQEVAAVHTALDGLGCKVEHVGSTAVPGLLAKPILDIAVGTPSDTNLFFDEVARRLAGMGLVGWWVLVEGEVLAVDLSAQAACDASMFETAHLNDQNSATPGEGCSVFFCSPLFKESVAHGF